MNEKNRVAASISLTVLAEVGLAGSRRPGTVAYPGPDQRANSISTVGKSNASLEPVTLPRSGPT